MALHLLTGTGAPGFSPDHVGQHYVDTLNGNEYFSTGTASSADWILRGSGGADNPMSEDLDVNDFLIVGKPETSGSGDGGSVDLVGAEGGTGAGTGNRRGGAVLIDGGDGGDTDYATNGNDNTDGGGFANTCRFKAGDGGRVTGNTVSHTAIGGTQGPPGSFVVVGDQTGIYNTPGFRFGYENDTGDAFGSDGGYTVTTATFGGVNTTINVNEEIGSGAATFDGDIYYDLATGSAASGADLQIHAGDGGGASFSKGDIGHGGDLELHAGDAGFNEYNPTESAFGGRIDLYAGDARGSSTGGRVDIETGRGGPNGGSGGNFEVDCGDGGAELAASTGNGGNLWLDAGDGGDVGGNGGHIRMIAGDAHFAALADSLGGWARLEGGRGGFSPYTPGANDGGDIFIQPGGHRDVDDVTAAGSVWFERTNLATTYTPAEVRWEDNQGGFVGWVGFKAPADVTTAVTGNGLNTVWTLPEGDGSDGAAMITDGAGTLSWSGVVPLERVITTSAPSAPTDPIFIFPMAFIGGPGMVRITADIVAWDTAVPEGGTGTYTVDAQWTGAPTSTLAVPGAPAPAFTFGGLLTSGSVIIAPVVDPVLDEVRLEVIQIGVSPAINWRANITVLVII